MNRAELLDLITLINVWLSLSSVLMVVASAIAIGVELWAVGVGLLLPSLLVFVVYTQDRRSVDPEDEINHPYRTRLVERYKRTLVASEAVAFLGYQTLLIWLVVMTPDVGPVFILLGQVPFVVALGYTRSKRYPGADSLLVGATWAYVVVFTITVSTGLVPGPELLGLFVAWLVMVFAGAEARNIPHRQGDRESGRPSIASRFGPRRTRPLEVALKISGVGLIWVIGGIWATLVVVVWLLFLLLCRRVERDREVAGRVRSSPAW